MKSRLTEKRPLELLEEAFHLLRLASGAALSSYYLGTLPFVLGVLFFWSDMARSAFAEQRLVPGALGLTLLFLWMKTWQAVFAQHLHARLCGEPAPRLTGSRLLRTAIIQGIIQPSGLFILPVALAILLPFGWLYAFYSNATVLAAAEDASPKGVLRHATRQALLWPLQNHGGLLLFKLFGLFVCFNLAGAAVLVPFLLKSFLGVETAFTQSWSAMLNTTLFAALAGLTYVCVDPIVKAFYVLRCFYGQSLQTGQDLKAELRKFLAQKKIAAAAVFLLCHTALNAPTAAGPPPSPPLEARPALTPPELDRSIDQVIQHREYSWRLPREKPVTPPPPAGQASWRQKLGNKLKKWSKDMGVWVRDFFNWIRKYFRPRTGEGSGGLGIAEVMRSLLVVLIVVIVAVLVWLLYRLWRHRPPAGAEVTAEALQPAPDLRDENLGADHLPEEGWLKMARDLLERGELRLALRAFYLASLAHLSEGGLITIAKFKSNRDYERELARRGHALPEVADLFTQNVFVFDRVWYGLHEVNRELLDEFSASVQRMKELV